MTEQLTCVDGVLLLRHLFETGNLRRTHLRGHPNILKRLLIHVCGFNLGLLLRQLTFGTTEARAGHRDAAEPPGPRGGSFWCTDRPRGQVLGPFDAILGSERHHPAGFAMARPGNTSIRQQDPRFTNNPFCHGLLDDRLT